MRIWTSIVAANVSFILACLAGEFVDVQFNLQRVPFWKMVSPAVAIWIAVFALGMYLQRKKSVLDPSVPSKENGPESEALSR